MEQEGPMDLEDFEHDIPEMPSAKVLLKEIIKILKKKNVNINFMSFYFAQKSRQQPPGMFIDDDENSEE